MVQCTPVLEGCPAGSLPCPWAGALPRPLATISLRFRITAARIWAKSNPTEENPQTILQSKIFYEKCNFKFPVCWKKKKRCWANERHNCVASPLVCFRPCTLVPWTPSGAAFPDPGVLTDGAPRALSADGPWFPLPCVTALQLRVVYFTFSCSLVTS